MKSYTNVEEKIATIGCLIEIAKCYCDNYCVNSDEVSNLSILFEILIREQHSLEKDFDTMLMENFENCT